MLPENVKPEEVMHPTGVFFRNPTHKEIADESSDQSQIVKAIKEARRDVLSQTITYTEEDKPWVLPGFAKIREMSEEEIEKFFKTLMRFRPNIFKIHLKLGNYPNTREINTAKTRFLNASEPRFHTEVATRLADIMADRSLKITEIIYTVQNTDPGRFQATGQVFGMVSDEDYANDAYFMPGIKIDYFPKQ